MKGKLYDNIFLHYKVAVHLNFYQNKPFSPASGRLVWGRGQNQGSGCSDLARLCEGWPEKDEADRLVRGVAAVPGLCHQLPAGGRWHHVQARRWSIQRERGKRRLEAFKMIKLYPPGPFPPNGKMIIIEQENSIQIPVRSFDTHGLSNVSPHLMSILHSIAIYLFELWFMIYYNQDFK